MTAFRYHLSVIAILFLILIVLVVKVHEKENRRRSSLRSEKAEDDEHALVSTTSNSGDYLREDEKLHEPAVEKLVRVIVKCKQGKESNCLDQLTDSPGTMIHKMTGTDYFTIQVKGSEEFLIQDLPDILELEADPPRYLQVLEDSAVYHRRKLIQDVPYGINLVKAIDVWRTFNTQGEGVKVCVMDTGLKRDHIDLIADNMHGPSNNLNNDLPSNWYQDVNGHGTHTTGTIAAADNDVGVVGVAPMVEIIVTKGTVLFKKLCCAGAVRISRD
jgi:subtilisin family serine protease